MRSIHAIRVFSAMTFSFLTKYGLLVTLRNRKGLLGVWKKGKRNNFRKSCRRAIITFGGKTWILKIRLRVFSWSNSFKRSPEMPKKSGWRPSCSTKTFGHGEKRDISKKCRRLIYPAAKQKATMFQLLLRLARHAKEYRRRHKSRL